MKSSRLVKSRLTIAFAIMAIGVAGIYAINFDPDGFKDESILAMLPLVGVVYFLLIRKIANPIEQIKFCTEKILNGDMEHRVDIGTNNELQAICDAINKMADNILNASDFIKNIEDGNLDIAYNSTKEEGDTEAETDPLEGALLSMRAQMKKIEADDKERNWTSEGLAKFMDLLRTDQNDLKKLCDSIVSSLVKYVGANQGGLFIVSDIEREEQEQELELIACYAYDRKKFVEKTVRLGEGLVGQTYLEKETIYMTNIPNEYVNITSGLGQANPSSVLIVPLKVNEDVFGIIELASFDEFPRYKIDFVEKLGENIASTISGVKGTEKTRRLLEDSQQQTEELRAQEEELRQNQEEMQATQEALQRKQDELAVSQEESEAIFENSIDAIIVACNDGVITNMNSAAKELFNIQVDEFGQNGREYFIQDIIRKFDPKNPKAFVDRRKRTKAYDSNGSMLNIEMYLNQVELGGDCNFMAYIRDIGKEIDKEQQIAENLMQLDELKVELKTLQEHSA
ncbi:MAG: GAF domain-containing protein [Bacteroidota bacterium]